MFHKIFAFSVSLLAFSSAALAGNPADVPLFKKPKVEETTPSVAINPKNPSRMIVTAVTSEGCKYRTSSNGGKSWSAARVLPFIVPAEDCRDAKVAYAPDGSRFYIAFLDAADRNDLYFAISRNEGNSWSKPLVILHHDDPNWDAGVLYVSTIMTPLDPKSVNWIYVIASVDALDYRYKIAITKDFGVHWDNKIIASAYFREGANYGFPTFSAGPGGNIAVAQECRDCARDDSFSRALSVTYSRDHGANFSSVQIPDDSIAGLGQPFDGRFPNLALSYGVQGVMHLIYPSDQSSGQMFRYRWSKPPFNVWSAPEFVASTEPGAASLSLQASNCGTATTLHLAWASRRAIAARTVYDVVYSQRAAAEGGRWSAPARISNAPSTFGASNYGDFPAISFDAERDAAFAAWLDRRDGNLSDVDVFGSIVPTGLSCP